MSQRLDDLIHRSGLRNFRATARHYDAAGTFDFAEGVQHREEGAYDRYVRGMIESGVCWRDPHARRALRWN
jgi:hypothetical protein